MQDIIDGFFQAIDLIISFDPVLWEIIVRSLQVSGIALLISAALGIPAGAYLGLRRVWGQGALTAILYTGMGLPPVVVGLVVYLLFSRSGPLGDLGWLFSVKAMVVAQTIIAVPLMIGLTMTAVRGVDPALRLQVRSLGATGRQEAMAVLGEARLGVIAAVVAAFGSIISEVGAVMLVGGNIAGKTRVLTTAIVLETRTGDFSFAIALGIILLSLAFLANVVFIRLQGRT